MSNIFVHVCKQSINTRVVLLHMTRKQPYMMGRITMQFFNFMHATILLYNLQYYFYIFEDTFIVFLILE